MHSAFCSKTRFPEECREGATKAAGLRQSSLSPSCPCKEAGSGRRPAEQGAVWSARFGTRVAPQLGALGRHVQRRRPATSLCLASEQRTPIPRSEPRICCCSAWDNGTVRTAAGSVPGSPTYSSLPPLASPLGPAMSASSFYRCQQGSSGPHRTHGKGGAGPGLRPSRV